MSERVNYLKINPTKEVKVKVKVAQSCPTLRNSMDYTAHGILQARILKWAAFPFSRGASWPRNQTKVSCIAGGFFTIKEVRELYSKKNVRCWWKKFRKTQTDGKTSHVLRLDELILLIWLYYLYIWKTQPLFFNTKLIIDREFLIEYFKGWCGRENTAAVEQCIIFLLLPHLT